MSTSERLRGSIDKLWDEYERMVRGHYNYAAEDIRKAIRRLEREYKRSVRREKREAGNN